MVTTDTLTLTTGPKPADTFMLPDTPPRDPDEMTSFDSLHSLGNSHHIIRHLGNEETTLVFTDKFISLNPTLGPDDLRRNPDLAVALNADRAAFLRRNGYIISEQGKAPDFVIEIASRSTARIDVGQKREDYAVMGITEYWRFDETGEFHGARLAGDRLVDGRYEPILIVELSEGVLEGYISVLDLNIRWEHGGLGWYDPATGLHIPTFDSERERANSEAEARADAEARANSEAEARDDAEARIRELEAEIRRIRGC